MEQEIEDILYKNIPVNYDGTTGSYQLKDAIQAICDYIDNNYVRRVYGTM